jgi:hypothetical protein
MCYCGTRCSFSTERKRAQGQNGINGGLARRGDLLPGDLLDKAKDITAQHQARLADIADGANFCFMVRAGSGAACARQGQAGIYVGNLKPKLVGRLREQASSCLGGR